MNEEVIVMIGAGGIGMAIARRQGFGRTVLLADSPLAELAEFDAGLNQVVVHGKRLRDGLFALSNVEAPLKTGR